MPLSMYQASIPVFVRMLNNLLVILDKGAAYAEQKKIEPSVLINDRLAADMFPLSRQVQIASDAVKGAAARLAGAEVPSFPDTETTFAELKERVKKTIAFAQGFKASQIDGSEERKISLKVGPNELNFTGQAYLLNFVLPNLYFHITTAYAILRHNGVPVGKMDFLGNPQEKLASAA
jgi:uncharacterized protein